MNYLLRERERERERQTEEIIIGGRKRHNKAPQVNKINKGGRWNTYEYAGSRKYVQSVSVK
jgi:hypothetical protein